MMKITTKLAGISGICIVLSACFAAPEYKGQKSDHFDGKEFSNSLSAKKPFSDYWRVSRDFFKNRTPWPEQVAVTHRKGLKFAPDEFSVTFIGHSTFLIRVDGLNILTDPVFSMYASPIQGRGPIRSRLPAIALNDLPKIDIILVSHNHYDHLDEASILGIFENQKDSPPTILAPLGNKALFSQWNIENAFDLDWSESKTVSGLKITLHETRHRSGRGIGDQMKTLWGGFVVDSSEGKIYFAGDTGYGPHFSQTFAESGKMRLSLIPIGAYEPRWFMAPIHLNPDQAVLAHKDLQSELSIGMHFGTFQLTIEGIDEPLIELAEALKKHNVPKKDFITIEFGQTLLLQ